MYKTEQWKKILDLTKIIKEEIFREKESAKEMQKESHPSLVRIRINDAKQKSFSSKIIRLRYCADGNSDLDPEPANLMRDFLLELAEAIWHHKQHIGLGSSEDIWLGEDRIYLRDLGQRLRERGYSERVITDITELLEKDLVEGFEKLKDTQDYKYFSRANPLSQPWIARENEVIAQIRSIYKKYTPLSDRQIISSMAILISEVDFWDDRKGDKERISTWFERIKKRLQTVDQHQSEPPEMFDIP